MNTMSAQYRLLRVSGQDHLDFLHRMLSNDVIGMSPDSASPSALLAINGRVVATLLLIREQDHVDLLIHPSLFEQVETQLSQMRFRSRVTFERPEGLTMIGRESGTVPSPVPDHWAFSRSSAWRIVHWPDQLQLWIADAGEPVTDALTHAGLSESQWCEKLIQVGHCWITAQTSDQYVAQMIDLHQGPAISFRKGCFPGQEVVARIRYKGRVKRSLYHCQSDHALEVGSTLRIGERRLGEIVNAAGHQALAVLSNDLDPMQQITEALSGQVVNVRRVFPAEQ